MPGLDPGIHVFLDFGKAKTWMAGSSPAMTSIWFFDEQLVRQNITTQKPKAPPGGGDRAGP